MSTDKKRPSFQFYPSDWLSSQRVALMTLEEEGAYVRALSYCWNHGSIPSDPEKLSRLIGKGASTTLATTLATMFQPHPNDPSKLVHSRLDAERAKQDEWLRKSAEGGRKSAQVRQNSKGASTTLPTTLPTTLETVVEKCLQPNGNSSSSSPSSSSVPIRTSSVAGDLLRESAPESTPAPKAPKFTPPTREELDLESAKIGLPALEVEKFVGHYGSNGWRVGKNPMRSWRHALAGWAARWRSEGGGLPPKANGTATAAPALTAAPTLSANVQAINWQRELDDVTQKMRDIRDSYDGHQTWTHTDVERWKVLKDRKNELKRLLGREV